MTDAPTTPAVTGDRFVRPAQRAHMTLHSDQLEQLLPALVKAMTGLPDIPRSREVTVRPREGQPYKFSYAPLDAIAKIVNPPLLENGLVLTQTQVRYADGDFLRTTLWHAVSGQFLASEVELHSSAKGTAAQYGAGLTYARRYGQSALLNITTETDNDAPEGGSKRQGQAQGGNQRNAQDSAEKIKPGDVRKLRQAIATTGRKEADVVAFYRDRYQIEKLEDLPASAFDRVFAQLKKPATNHHPEE